MKTVSAYLVHLLTASGGVVGAFALIIAKEGDTRLGLQLLLVALLIDCIDGPLARYVQVSKHAPDIDGLRLDIVVDFCNFSLFPLFILIYAGLFPLPVGAMLTLALVVSIHNSGRLHRNLAEGFYTGLPSCWNFIAIAIYICRPSPLTVYIVFFCQAVLSLSNLPFLYGSKPIRFRTSLYAMAAILGIAFEIGLWFPETFEKYHLSIVVWSLPVIYCVLSWTAARKRQGNMPSRLGQLPR